jgi:hypothetical protein
LLNFELGQTKLQSVRYISVSLFVILDQIDATLDFSVNIIVVGSIEISPQDVLLIEH